MMEMQGNVGLNALHLITFISTIQRMYICVYKAAQMELMDYKTIHGLV